MVRKSFKKHGDPNNDMILTNDYDKNPQKWENKARKVFKRKYGYHPKTEQEVDEMLEIAGDLHSKNFLKRGIADRRSWNVGDTLAVSGGSAIGAGVAGIDTISRRKK